MSRNTPGGGGRAETRQPIELSMHNCCPLTGESKATGQSRVGRSRDTLGLGRPGEEKSSGRREDFSEKSNNHTEGGEKQKKEPKQTPDKGEESPEAHWQASVSTPHYRGLMLSQVTTCSSKDERQRKTPRAHWQAGAKQKDRVVCAVVN